MKRIDLLFNAGLVFMGSAIGMTLTNVLTILQAPVIESQVITTTISLVVGAACLGFSGFLYIKEKEKRGFDQVIIAPTIPPPSYSECLQHFNHAKTNQEPSAPPIEIVEQNTSQKINILN